MVAMRSVGIIPARYESERFPGKPLAAIAGRPMIQHVYERVRAARWLENLTCREFAPPPAEVAFAPYQRDPGTEGVCQHCHQIIDVVEKFAPRG